MSYTGFLTAVLQNHARKIGVSVDSLHFDFKVLFDASESQASLNNVKKKLDVKQKGFKVCMLSVKFQQTVIESFHATALIFTFCFILDMI